MKKRGLIERLEHEPVICAEGFLFEAERRGYLASGEFVPELALENPEALKNIHIDFQKYMIFVFFIQKIVNAV